MSRAVLLAAFLTALVAALPARAQNLLMVRSDQSFPEAMLALQEAITAHGYTVSRVQRVDIGLTASGYETDMYRLVFFGRPEEIRSLTAAYPQLVPYLPLQITLFAEAQETLAVTIDPLLYSRLVQDVKVQPTFRQWRKDVQGIMDSLAK